MLVIFCLSLIALSQAKAIDNNYDYVTLHNTEHKKEILKTGLSKPYQLAVDYDTNILFFSITDWGGVDSYFKSAYLDMNSNVYATIPGLTGGFANAVDGRNHTVYLGGSDGIYTYDYDEKKAVYLTARDSNIWQMFFKDKLYYTVYTTKTAYYYEDGISKKVPELKNTHVNMMAIDNIENIVFGNFSGIYCHKKTQDETFLLGKFTLAALTSDKNGNLYFATSDALYSINENGQQFEKIISIPDIYGLAIDGDNNIIYATGDSIVRLKPTNHNTGHTPTY